jgi:hypothetical protein
MGKKSNRLRRLLRKGGTPFTCFHCDAVFASDRDRLNHIKAPMKGKKAMVNRRPTYYPMNDNHKDYNRGHGHEAHRHGFARGVTRLFAKDKEELFVIDFVTPHTSLRCGHAGCTSSEAIPLTGLCIAHDPLCAAYALAEAMKKNTRSETANLPNIGMTPDGEDLRGWFH